MGASINQRRTLFLGGTVGNSSWRDEVTELLADNYFCRNPLKEKDPDRVFKWRRECDFRLYVISPCENEIFKCIAELVDDVNNRPLFTLMTILEEDKGKMWGEIEREELIKLANICNMRCVRGGCFYNIKELCEYMNKT